MRDFEYLVMYAEWPLDRDGFYITPFPRRQVLTETLDEFIQYVASHEFETTWR